MKFSIADDVFERVEEESLTQAKDALSKGLYEEAEAIGVVTLIKAGIMTQLNLMGMDIWDKLRTPITVEEISRMISSEYGISYDECFCDVNEFVQDLFEKGFLKNE